MPSILPEFVATTSPATVSPAKLRNAASADRSDGSASSFRDSLAAETRQQSRADASRASERTGKDDAVRNGDANKSVDRAADSAESAEGSVTDNAETDSAAADQDRPTEYTSGFPHNLLVKEPAVPATGPLTDGVASKAAGTPLLISDFVNGRAMLSGKADSSLPGPSLTPNAELGTQAAPASVTLLNTGKTGDLSLNPQMGSLNLASAVGKAFKLETTQLGLPGASTQAAGEAFDIGSALTSLNPISGTAGASLGDAASGRVQVPITVTFGQPQWAGMVAERSAQLFSQNINNAELLLDPPELGRMTVHIQVHQNDQASVTFTSANPSVREALDQSSQRLRDLMAEQGLNLVDVDVSDERSPQSRDPESDSRSGPAVATNDTADDDADMVASPTNDTLHATVSTGIDHYV